MESGQTVSKSEWSAERIRAGAVSSLPVAHPDYSDDENSGWEKVSPSTLRKLEMNVGKRSQAPNDRRTRSKKQRRLDLKIGIKVWATWDSDPTPYPATVKKIVQDRVHLRYDDGFEWDRAPTSTVVALL